MSMSRIHATTSNEGGCTWGACIEADPLSHHPLSHSRVVAYSGRRKGSPPLAGGAGRVQPQSLEAEEPAPTPIVSHPGRRF